jgi:hypothetical protein
MTLVGRYRLSTLAVVVLLVGCSENVGERLARECGQIVDASTSPEDAITGDAKTVRAYGFNVFLDQSSLRDAYHAYRAKNPTGESFADFAEKTDHAEYSRLWQKVFDQDLPRRKEVREKLVRECVWKRGTKETNR